MNDDWLRHIVDDAVRKFAAWPKWKQDAHRREVRRSFVYGNCAIENRLVTREMVDDTDLSEPRTWIESPELPT